MALSSTQKYIIGGVLVVVLGLAAAWASGMFDSMHIAEDCAALSGSVPVKTADVASQEDHRVECYKAANCIYDDATAVCSKAPSVSKDNVKTSVKYNCYLGDTGNCLEYSHCQILDDECRPK